MAAVRTTNEYRFNYDHVLGTSLDVAVWAERATSAETANDAALAEIDRLSGILSTYSPLSEISRLEHSAGSFFCSSELFDVLSAYEMWDRRTEGALAIERGERRLVLSPSQRLAVRRTSVWGPAEPLAPLNVDALGKAFVIDRAVAAGRRAAPDVMSMVVNIGGDIVLSGRAQEISVAHPLAPYDNGQSLTRVVLEDRAIATSGTYERGEHLRHARTGRVSDVAGVTAIASDCLTANALATAGCVMQEDRAVQLVQSVPGAAALFVRRDGSERRTSGFFTFEQQRSACRAPSRWPNGYQVSIDLTILGATGFRSRRPYVAIWAEDARGSLVRMIAVWGASQRYLADLPAFWNLARQDQTLLYAFTRATRDPGRYKLVWDGLDDHGRVVSPGTYQIVVEVNQEHGYYGRQSGSIVCGDTPSSATLKETANFAPVAIHYGPRATSL